MKQTIRFLGCRIDTSKRVFIPRPETEFWVEKAIETIKKMANSKQSGLDSKQIKILDIFAGSGCIGIAVLRNTKNTFVDFVDIDKNAIEQIKINLLKNKIPKHRYRVHKSDIFQDLRNQKYDFILANPPYCALKRINEVDPEVLKNEPHIALLAGEDGMFYIRKFLRQAKIYLKPKGIIFMEFDPQQKSEIEEILKREGFKFEIKKDQYKKWRYIIAKNYVDQS